MSRFAFRLCDFLFGVSSALTAREHFFSERATAFACRREQLELAAFRREARDGRSSTVAWASLIRVRAPLRVNDSGMCRTAVVERRM
jgi:hypothetical protein